jgi:hypothetical protein
VKSPIKSIRRWGLAAFFCLFLISTNFSFAITNQIFFTTFSKSGVLAWTNATPVSVPSSTSNSVYQIQRTTNLVGTWNVLPGFAAISGGVSQVQISTLTNSSSFYRLLCLNPVVSDSIVDFSTVQGSNNWFYGYYGGNSATPYSTGDFQLMTNVVPGGGFNGLDAWFEEDGTFWTSLWFNGGHPNGIVTSYGRATLQQWAVRRWVSTINGTIHIHGVLADLDNGAGNGVIGHIIIDGNDQSVYTIDNGGRTNFVFNAVVSVGSIVDFAIDPRDNNDYADSTAFYFTIQR